MAEVLTIIVVLGVLVLAITRMRTHGLHFRVADWPLGKQLEGSLALVFAVAAALGTIAGEYAFAGWLGLMSAIVATFAVLTWPRDR